MNVKIHMKENEEKINDQNYSDKKMKKKVKIEEMKILVISTLKE